MLLDYQIRATPTIKSMAENISSLRHGPTVRIFWQFLMRGSEYRWCPGIDQKLLFNLGCKVPCYIANGLMNVSEKNWQNMPYKGSSLKVSTSHWTRMIQRIEMTWRTYTYWHSTYQWEVFTNPCIKRTVYRNTHENVEIYEDEKVKDHNESSFFFGMIIKYPILKKQLIHSIHWPASYIVRITAWCMHNVFPKKPQFSSVN